MKFLVPYVLETVAANPNDVEGGNIQVK